MRFFLGRPEQHCVPCVQCGQRVVWLVVGKWTTFVTHNGVPHCVTRSERP